MAYAPVSHTKVQGANAGTTASIDTTGATLLVLVVSQYHGGTSVTVSDSKSNTWTELTRQSLSTPDIIIYYAKNPTVGTGHTFTGSGANSFSSIFVAAFSGADTSAPFDVQNGNSNGTSTTTSLSTGSVTPTVDNELVIAALCNSVGTGVSINGSFTITDSNDSVGGDHEGGGLAYLIQTTKTAANPTWSWTSGGACAAAIASFKAAGGAAPTGWGPLLGGQRNRLLLAA